jgi:cellulose synthase/poly-beta-1,6-N-acetylglucosamine synthase-like glycosyltransferase
MLKLAGFVTALLTRVVLIVTVLVAIRLLAGLILARVQLARAGRLAADPGFAPAISVLVPAHNEEPVIERTVRSLASSSYGGELEVIVVDDGSTDATAAIVERLALPRVRLLRQASAGKAAALNGALGASRHDIIVTVDADTVFEPDTLRELVRRFREPNVGAISGNTKVGNRRGLIGRWQHIEYVMGFNLDRRMYEVLGCTPTVPGAIGAFRRAALADIGGVSGATLAEDTDITLDLGRAGWRVLYEDRARAWTEAPSTARAFYRQRRRWAYGTIQSMWKHRRALWSWRRGQGAGARALAALALFQVALPLAAPLIDLFAIYAIIFLDPLPILAFWGAFNLFQLALAWTAFGLDHESRRDLWALPLQQFLHRQICYLVVYDAIVSALLGNRLGWRRVQRTGDVALVGGELASASVADGPSAART